MPWFVKLEKGIVDKNTFDQHVPAHKAYVRDLIEQGHQAKTGYWGCFANSMTEAEAIVAQDPLIKSGCVKYELYEWRIVVE